MPEPDPATAARELLDDQFERIHELVASVVDDLPPAAFTFAPAPGANTIAWLLWHLIRIQDDHVADLAGVPQAWEAGGWRAQFDLPFAADATGYGHGPDDVAAVQVQDPDLFTGYHEAVHALTTAYLDGIDAEELARVVDERWDPPVTASVRLVSVVGDCLQHLGQAAYVKGLAPR